MRTRILKSLTTILSVCALCLALAGTAQAAPTPPITCKGELCQAISAALSRIQKVNPNVKISHPEEAYLDILKDFFLVDEQGEVPDLFLPQGVPPLQNPPPLADDACIIADHPYPAVTEGSLLDHVLNKGEIRVLWVPQAVPFSFEIDGQPAGLSLAMWELITEEISNHYGANVQAKFIKSPGISVNNQFAALARPDDLNCKNPTPEQLAVASKGKIKKGCSDVIGGGYAITPPRKLLSDLTCTYMPLTMNAVRTQEPLPFPINFDVTNNPNSPAEFLVAKIRAEVSDDNSVTIAAIAGSAEVPFVWFNFCCDPDNPPGTPPGPTNLLPGITLVERDGTENIFTYAENNPDGAHFVLGQIARLTYFRNPAVTDPAICPEVGDDCRFLLMNPLAIEGTAFGTYKVPSP